MAKIIHYRNKCIGCNSCVEQDPARWKINDEDGKSDLIGSIQKKNTWIAKIDYEELDRNKQAAKDCPVSIIKIIE